MSYKNYYLDLTKLSKISITEQEKIHDYYKDMLLLVEENRENIAESYFNTLFKGEFLKEIRDEKLKELLGENVCDRPHPGVGVIIESKIGKYLLMRRLGSHGEGTWGFPGGKLEKNESIQECAIREVKEEIDLDISDIHLDKYTNDVFKDDDLHYVTLFVKCKEYTGLPKIMEPDKCLEIKWFDKDKLPDNLFLPIKNYIKHNGTF